VEESILLSTKKILGLTPEYTAFDQDILTHINAAFSTLSQVGTGPDAGYMIEDEAALWSEFITDPVSLNMVKSYIYLSVRLLFDPPGTSFHLEAMKNQIKEYEWRLSALREVTY
jgi:hypothetical protein